MANSKLAIGIVAGAVVLCTMAFLTPERTPEQEAATNAQLNLKDTIDYCWRDQAKKSYDPSTAQFVAGICEAAERKYHNEYGRWYRRNGL